MELFPKDDLQKVFGLKKKVGKLFFSEVIEASGGHKLLAMDMADPNDVALIKHLVFALNKFVALSKKTGQRFHGGRINEIGKQIESLIEAEVRKTPLEINKLGSSGYPDFEITHNHRVTYLELKSSGNINQARTHHRMFYFTSAKKIKNDARHLLLQLQMEEESNKYWKVISWKIRDLSGLKVSLKPEFNATFQDFEKTPLLYEG